MLLGIVIVGILIRAICGCDFSDFENWASKRLETFGPNVSNVCDALSGGFSSPKGSNPHIFLFQSDEHEVLADWLQYHSYLVGLKNIHIVDQESQNPQICKLLALYKSCGVDITIENSFVNKHRALSGLMKMYNSSFLIPMDADEFIAVNGSTPQFTSDREIILNQWRNLSVDGRKYKFASVVARYDAVECKITKKNAGFDPQYRRVTKKAMAGPPQYPPHMLKTFFYSDGFIATDQGNHHGIVQHDMGHNMSRDPVVKENLAHYFQFTNLTLIHYFASSYHSMRHKILRAAKAYNFTATTNCDNITTNGLQYCRLAKGYEASSLSSHVHYLQNCRTFDSPKGSKVPSVSLSSFREWFVVHAKSFADLIGEELKPRKAL